MEAINWQDYAVWFMAGVGGMFVLVNFATWMKAKWQARNFVELEPLIQEFLEMQEALMSNSEMISLLCEEVGKLKGNVESEYTNGIGEKYDVLEPPKKKRGRPRKNAKLN